MEKMEMENEKVKYVIDMIKDMLTGTKLRLAICMCDSSTTHIEYNKKEMYKHFDRLLREVDIIYRTTVVDFTEYPYIIFVMAKIMEMNPNEQNQVALYLFNSINNDIRKKYKYIYEALDNIEQMF